MSSADSHSKSIAPLPFSLKKFQSFARSSLSPTTKLPQSPLPCYYPPARDRERLCADRCVALRQVAEMHLDERLEKSREVIGKQLAVGQKKVSSAFNNLWAEMEAMREAQRLKREAELQAGTSDGGKAQGQHAGKCMYIFFFHFPPLPSRSPTSTPSQHASRTLQTTSLATNHP